MMLEPVLTPHGSLILRPTEEAPALESAQDSRLAKVFGRGAGHGLLCLVVDEVGTALPPVLSYWREFGAHYVSALCAVPNKARAVPSRLCPSPRMSSWTRWPPLFRPWQVRNI